MSRKVLRAGLPGIADVASLAGVSLATVSRYYNSPELVKEATRQQIASAVDKLGYVPHAAKALGPQESGTIGLIVPTIDNAIFAETIQQFSITLFRHARTMLIAAHGYDLARESILTESLLNHGVDAIALVGLEHTEKTNEQLAKCNIPSVFLWNYRNRQERPCIGIDNREAGRTAVQYLWELGHRDILLLLADTRANDRAADRRAGALGFLKASGVSVPAERRVVCPYDVQASKNMVVKMLSEMMPRPTAVFGSNDIIAQGALFAALSLGISVPDELSIIGIGDFRGSSAVEPGLTTLRVPARRIGQSAAEALIEMKKWPNAEIEHDQKFDAELVVRRSTAPPIRIAKYKGK
jgi:LacI family transcriptional regulator, galactose operon repressor